MNETQELIRSQLIPIHKDILLLPNTTVAEISAYNEPEPIIDAPDWILGILNWRGLKVPLISIEKAQGVELPTPSSRNRVAILNTLGSSPNMPFVAIIIQGLPRLTRVEKSSIVFAPNKSEQKKFLLSNVIVNKVQASIPNMDEIAESVSNSQINLH